MRSTPQLGRLGAALAAATLVAAALAAPAPSRAQIVEQPIPGGPVTIDSGLVAGKMVGPKVKAWLGVPFAAAPVRELRWRPPAPVKPWTGVYNADRKGPECIQPLRAHDINHYFGEEPTSEDCLYLNVWAPASAKPGAKLPVIVFMYGGGSTIGSSGMALYAGDAVAARGAIFVNFNYRVGAFGFMAHPDLTAESPNKTSGNYAHLDQIAALKWIQRNIARFGGDPTKVVISGQSAGAASVAVMQASPLAKGLFRGVVGMSGGVWGNGGEGLQTLAEAQTKGVQIQTALKAASIEALRQIPADRILALQEDCQLGCTSGNIRVGGANIDGYLLPQSPAKLFAAKQQSDVPVIVGFMRDESRNDLSSARTKADYEAAAQRLYGDQAGELLKLYPVADDGQAEAQGRAAAREGGMGRTVRNWAVAQNRWGSAPVYVYQLSRVQPFNPAVEIADHPERIGVYHTSDVPYWFGSLDAFNLFRPTRLWTPADRTLSTAMTDSLIAFANTGVPTTAALPWRAWTPGNEALLDIDAPTSKVAPMAADRWRFQADHPPRPSTQTPARPTRD